MMEPLDYLHLQLRLEGKEIVNGRFIREVEAIPDEEVPLLLIAQLSNEEIVVYYDETLSRELQENLAVMTIDLEFPMIAPLLETLKKQKLEIDIGHYRTYVFPSIPVIDRNVHCLSKENKKVKAFGFDGFAGQVYVIEREGNIVSACVSTRENEKCGEAWVFTSPEYRHKGLAQNVVSAWAGSLIRAGKIPFYSHKIQNSASANLARSLKLHPVFEEIVITRA